MDKATSLIHKLRLLLSCFLLLSFLSTSLQLSTHFDSNVSLLLSSKINKAIPSDSEVPMNETEKALEEKCKDGFVLYTLSNFRNILTSLDAASLVPFSQLASAGSFWQVPLYISKRSLIL